MAGRPGQSPAMETHGIRLSRHGGPEVLQWEAFDVPPPGPGQALLRQTAVGLNFIDVYQRTGLYPQAMPFIPGSEGAGVVEAVGEGVSVVAPGDRVAYAGAVGAYAERRLIAADRLVKLPPGIDDTMAAAMMLQGMTVQYLIRRTYRVAVGGYHPDPRRGRWDRADPLPVGHLARRHRDRHRLVFGRRPTSPARMAVRSSRW